MRSILICVWLLAMLGLLAVGCTGHFLCVPAALTLFVVGEWCLPQRTDLSQRTDAPQCTSEPHE